MIPDRSELHGGDEEIVNRALSRAKGAWAASLREDDRLYRDASEERLAASWPRPRVLPVRSFVLGAAAAACVAAIAFVAVRSSDGAQLARAKEVVASAPAPTASPAAPFVAPIAPLSTATVTTATATSPEARAAVTTRGIVATGACPDCRVGGSAMEPGISIGAGRALTVPRGARVTLGFALGEGAPDSAGTTTRSLVDPAVGVDVEGPAVATLPDDGTISLDRGSARFRGLRDIAVAVPGGRLDSSGATFTVRIDGQGIARISVEKGRVVVTSGASHESHDVAAGSSIEVASAPASSASPPSPAPPQAPVAPRSVTAAAPPAGTAASTSTTPAMTPAAAFKLAELEMANGQRERGRARLAELTTSSDVRLASDAATLLARSEPTPAARADAWARYLATSPPAAYRDRALLERADALVDAGRTNEANAIVTELRTASLTDAQRRQLERVASKASERH